MIIVMRVLLLLLLMQLLRSNQLRLLARRCHDVLLLALHGYLLSGGSPSHLIDHDLLLRNLLLLHHLLLLFLLQLLHQYGLLLSCQLLLVCSRVLRAQRWAKLGSQNVAPAGRVQLPCSTATCSFLYIKVSRLP